MRRIGYHNARTLQTNIRYVPRPHRYPRSLIIGFVFLTASATAAGLYFIWGI